MKKQNELFLIGELNGKTAIFGMGNTIGTARAAGMWNAMNAGLGLDDFWIVPETRLPKGAVWFDTL